MVIETVLNTIAYCPLGKQRCPAFADVLQNGFLSDDVQVGILLARKGGCWQIFSRCAGPYGIGISFAKLYEATRNCFSYLLSNRNAFDDSTDLCADCADILLLVCLQMR